MLLMLEKFADTFACGGRNQVMGARAPLCLEMLVLTWALMLLSAALNLQVFF